MHYRFTGPRQLLAALVVTTGLLAQSVAAQATTDHVRVGVAAGVARSSGIGGGTGYHLVATMSAPSPVQPLSFRVDGTFGQWGVGGEGRVASLAAGLNFTPVRLQEFQPFVSALAGTYYTPRRSGLVAGWSLGVGLEVRRGVFVESRVHALQQNGTHVIRYGAPGEDRLWKTIWMPLSVGMRF
ncbi:MAG: hypothetical protein ACYC4J_10710 [Gemmatimonadaceae bacterium]